MTSTAPRPTRSEAEKAEPRRRGLAARVSLGRILTPVPSEFLLIASTAVLLTGFGLVMILSATSASPEPFDGVLKQGVFAVIGLPLMFIVSRLPVLFFKRIAWIALIGAVVFQLLVFTPLGYELYGNRNWIEIAGITAQPSEFLKLALALWLGYVLFRKQTLLGLWRHVFIPVVPVVALVIATVMAGHDLGTAIVLFLIALGALFFSGVKLRIFIIPLVLSGLASGGIFGLGLGNSKEKYDWLPAAANDYIFAIVGEELGLIGCAVVLALFALFAVGAFHIIRKTDDPFVRIVSGGITVWIVGQALINVGVVLRVFPVLGVPLPFMSQGGTSLLSVLIASGVLLAFARTLPARRQPPLVQPPR